MELTEQRSIRPGGEHAIRQGGELRSTRIESLRALAALAVLGTHVFALDYGWRGVYTGFWHLALMSGGSGGLFVFFVLTGYLLFWPLAKRDYAGGREVRLRGYVVNRALRILPLYYAVIAVFVATGLWMGPHRELWRFLLLLENFSGRTVRTGDGPMWTLIIEIQFYALLPFLALGLARLARQRAARATAALAVLGGLSLALRLALHAGSGRHALWAASLPTTFFLFVLGMLLAMIRLRWEQRAPRLPPAMLRGETWLGGGILLWLAFLWQPLAPGFVIVIAAAAFLVAGACVLPLAHGRFSKLLEWRPLAVLGIASYSLYLLHVPIVNRLSATSLAARGAGGLLRFAAVAIPLCCLLSLVSYAAVERPFLRLRRRWFDSRPASEPSDRPAAIDVIAAGLSEPATEAQARR